MVYIAKEEECKLKERSKGLCEVCWTAITLDKHHIHPRCLWGPNTAENLLCLCPTCHRQIPETFNQTQQKIFQSRHKEMVLWNFNHHLSSPTCSFIVWWCTYKSPYIVTINWHPIIFFHEINGEFYINIIMLSDWFDSKLLILDSRVIYNENYDVGIDSYHFIIRKLQSPLSAPICSFRRVGNNIQVELNFIYRGESIAFWEKSTKICNTTLTNCSVETKWSFVDIVSPSELSDDPINVNCFIRRTVM